MLDQQWDKEVDLIVVGFGGAGAAAALAADEQGATVLVIEKQSREEHYPSTYMSGGIIMVVNDAAQGARYLDRCSGGMIPYAVSRAWAKRAVDLVDWLEKVGTDLALERVGGAEHPEFEGAEAIDSYSQSRPSESAPSQDLRIPENMNVVAGGVDATQMARRTGREYFTSLRTVVESRDRIEVLYDSPGRRLIQDGTGRVVGVSASSNDSNRSFRARRGVVLTTGGYEFNDEMKLNYMKASPIYFYGSTANTGDGVRMAQAVGADLWHMNQMIGRAIGHFEGDDGREYNFVIGIHPPGYVITDKYGLRFANEVKQAEMKHSFYCHLLQYDADKNEYPRNPCYWFFDRRRFEAAPLTSLQAGVVGTGGYAWSPDNSAQVANGWIKSADTIEEVARMAGVADPQSAAESVRAYNEGCATGNDMFDRPAESLVPLDSPPFYCVPLYPGGSNTCGGPRRDERARVLDAFGEPIPGLYAAGELGESVGLLYPANGSNLSESVCFGRIAATDALGAEDS